tara:strand:+ start:14520 stop:15413 length:894 start_codon:yes stop_codon:yes gene_type:complete
MASLLDATKEKMVSDTRQAVRRLSEIYKFDIDEALHRLSIGEHTPAKRVKVTPEPKVTSKTKAKVNTNGILPWCGQIIDDNCMGIRFNKGMFTQCKAKPMSNGKCAACLDTTKRVVCCGDIRQRSDDNWSDTKGRKPVRYSKIMKKIGVTREEAEQAAASIGWTIPEIEFSEVGSARRGRPPKTKPLVSANTGNLMLDELVRGAQEMSISKGLSPASKLDKERSYELFGTESDEDEIEESDYELEVTPTQVVKVKGKDYLFDERTNSAYDMQTQTRVGVTTPGRSQFSQFWQSGLID